MCTKERATEAPGQGDQIMIGPDGTIVFAAGGVLEPGWKAAIAMLDLEGKIAANELEILASEKEPDMEHAESLGARIRACEVAVALLKIQGQRLGIDA